MTIPPEGWALCDGRVLQINNNQELYAVIGNQYGGQLAKSTFALPDLRGRAPIGLGQGNGLTNHQIGETGGQKPVTIPKDYVRAGTPEEAGYGGIKLRVINEELDLPTMPPYMAINFIIAMIGYFPQRPH